MQAHYSNLLCIFLSFLRSIVCTSCRKKYFLLLYTWKKFQFDIQGVKLRNKCMLGTVFVLVQGLRLETSRLLFFIITQLWVTSKTKFLDFFHISSADFLHPTHLLYHRANVFCSGGYCCLFLFSLTSKIFQIIFLKSKIYKTQQNN